MHVCSTGSALLVNAEVDSMGGVVDGGDGVVTKPSPLRTAIEKAQIELKQEYGVREERRRELEFLEKGGNPLDFKFGNAASVSVQSTSLTDQHPEHFVTSEAKGSFALTASPYGDSVESSGRPGGALSVCEPNSADNLMLFDGESEFRKARLQIAKELGDSAAFGIPRKAYKRRNRSRPNRDIARSISTDLIPSHKGFIIDADKQKDRKISSNLNTKDSVAVKTLHSDSRDDVAGVESTTCLIKRGLPDVPEAPIDMASGELNQVNNKAISGQMNGFRSSKRDKRSIPNGGETNSGGGFNTKGLDSDSSCTQISVSLDGNNDNEMCTTLKNINFYENAKEQTLETPSTEGNKSVKEKNESKGDGNCGVTNDDYGAISKSHEKDSSVLRLEEALEGSGPGLQNDVNNPSTSGGRDQDGLTASKTERKPSNLLGSKLEENACAGTPKGLVDSSNEERFETKGPVRAFTAAPQRQICSGISLKLDNKALQDCILEEARIIEAKRKRIAELSVGTLQLENRRKSHWDFVLEEVAWLANDFAQERLWKITAAAQICHQVAFSSRLRIQEQNLRWKPKELAHTLAKAVMEFWHSVQDTSKELELQCPQKKITNAVQSYAMRFLKHNSPNVQHCAPEAPLTPEKKYDFGVLDMSWEDHLTEENLFYTIPSGAMEVYRKCIESHVLHCEKIGSTMQEEVETSGYNAVTEFGSQENVFEEEEGETSSYYLPGAFEGSKSSKFAQKKRNNLPFNQYTENKVGGQQSVLIGKRPGNSLNVSFHTKRIRTASRPKVLNPFSGGTRAPNKTDASSGDTNSFQDEQITLPTTLEADSVGDFEKKLPYDSAEVSNKPKKKKKAKHLGSTYEQRWQLDSNFHNEQRDHSKRTSESYQLESNGSSGLFGQHVMKKPKMMRQSLDNSFENIPSHVASQMSNMSKSNKFIKIIGGRDRRRKPKPTKMPAGQLDSGSPWSQYEDQALVVLVHDMGPNWELVSDALNSGLQFKKIFRKAKECKERHNFLMDRTAGDGADSAEDSGSSQPYPSTLPGIPKGSARQLFHHLHGPMEEDTLKSHFEKIIKIGKKQNYPRTRNDNLEPKQLQQPHSSHSLALSQACPNNLSGGPILTPLDLCDATASSPDILPVGYQVPHPSGLSISKAGPVGPILPTSGANSSVQCASSVVPTGNASTQSSPLNSSVRDGRYGIARTASSDEQQRLQQYNQMLPGRNFPQSSLPGPVRILPGGNSSVMCGLNRSVPMTRPSFQGVATSSMLNSPSMLSLPPGQGNSMLRPRDPLHKMRPSQNPEHQMQVPQGNIHGVAPFNGLSSSFSNQTAPPVQSYPVLRAMPPQRSHLLNSSHIQRPNNHATSTQHQAYAVRFAKERQQQRLLLQQQQQQIAASNGVMPHVQSQPQPPVSSPQNSPQIQTQNSSPPVVSVSPPQKHQMPPHGVSWNPQVGGSGLPNQMGKQQQCQQFLPAGRHHPEPRQQSPAQQPAKLVKGVGRGNPLSDSSLPNGLSAPSLVPPHPLPKQHQLSSNQNHVSSVAAGPTQTQPKLLNQNNPTAQRLLQPSKLQPKEAQAEQNRANNSAALLNVPPAVSSASPAQLGPPNHVTKVGPQWDPPLTNSVGGEPGPQVGQGQSSGSLTPVGPDKQQPPTLLSPPVQEQQTQNLQSGNNSLYVGPTSSRTE